MKPKRKSGQKKAVRILALVACGLMLLFALAAPLSMMWG